MASQAQLDRVCFTFMAALTAVGGGTLCDLILGHDMVFLVVHPADVVIAAAMTPIWMGLVRLEALVDWSLQAGSLSFGWQLPVYRPRQPRPRRGQNTAVQHLATAGAKWRSLFHLD